MTTLLEEDGEGQLDRQSVRGGAWRLALQKNHSQGLLSAAGRCQSVTRLLDVDTGALLFVGGNSRLAESLAG